MESAHTFLAALTAVLCVAAVTTVLFQRLRQPVVLGYILAGLIVGPHVPIPLVADGATIRTLSELGVILLMFSLGLEFSLRALVRVGPTAGLTAVIETSLMVWLGFAVGRAFGWGDLESFVAGAIVAISSTTIVAKAFAERSIEGRRRELVVGILIAEDLIAILLMAALTAAAGSSGLQAGDLAASIGKLVGFLLAMVTVGMLVVPRLIRAIVRLERPETTLVSCIGLCFATALLVQMLGYSVALGAFLAGMLIAESGEEKQVAMLIEPVRDMFAAIFFVSVGMSIDPLLIAEHWAAIAALTVVVLIGKVFGVSLGAFLTGNGVRGSVAAGMSLAQIGEFSFIIAGLGVSVGATGGFLFPIAVAVSSITALTTPWLIGAAGPVASRLDRALPESLQTFASLYGSWVERMRASAPRRPSGRVSRLVRLLLLDAAIVAGLVVGGLAGGDRIAVELGGRIGVHGSVAHALVVIGALVLSLPFSIGVVRIVRRLGVALAERALPAQADGTLDLAAAPRRALVVTMQLGLLLLIGAPLVAISQPFLPGWHGAAALGVVFAGFAVAFWRSATNLQGHVRAGAAMIVEALAAQSQSDRSSERGVPPSLSQVNEMLIGLGEPTPIVLARSSPAVDRTLAELDLRGQTGATVLAITRGGEGVVIPTAKETLRAGDVLAVAGTQDAIEAARALLTPPE